MQAPRVEGFEVLRPLGAGGMAQVWLAREWATGELCALKVLAEHDPRLAARLRREGEVQRELVHEHVVRVTGAVQTEDGRPALRMAYIEGPTLAELLGAGCALDVDEIDALGRGILSGVAAAHGRGWVHRDIKPGNVLLALGDGVLVPRVSDFGLVKVLDEDGRAVAGETTRRGLGTQRYMSLEQLLGQPADARMDVFALGAVLYELAEGVPAFPTRAAWERAIRTDTMPALARSDLPEGLRRAVDAALAPFARRPRDAAELLALWPEDRALAGRFRPQTLRIARVAAAHLPLGRSEPADALEAEHLSLCARCRTARASAGEAPSPPPPVQPREEGPLAVIAWAEGDVAPEIERLCAEHRGRTGAIADGLAEVRFGEPSDGVRFAAALHRALEERSLSVQLALDAGASADLAASLARLARPGQTLATRAGGERLISHGRWRLPDRMDVIELFEAGDPPGVPPPEGPRGWRVALRDGSWQPERPVPHALPAERDAFVGREAELRALAERLRAGERLVTVHGAAGVGKTRLVLRYARAWLGAWPGGAWFCDLSDARDTDGIAAAVARALDVPLGRTDPVVQLGHAIAARGRCLVILDNFEQLIEHADATLRRWLDRAPEASFVATSRAVLGVAEEAVSPLEPLGAEQGAALFAERARTARRDFDLLRHTEAIERLVALLDGLPLAIELCAARAATMRPDQMLARMGERFRLIAGGEGRPDRQATLRAALDWSHELLHPWEQAALAQLSVFEGGFTPEAARAGIDTSPFPEAPPAADIVRSLLDRALLRVLPEGRFGMLVSVQQYAHERLSDEEQRRAAERHGRYYATFGTDEALDALTTHGGLARLIALSRELDNLAAASQRAVARGDGEVAAATALAAWRMFEMRGPLTVGVALIEAAIVLPSNRQTRLSWISGKTRQMSGRLAEARERYDEALAGARADGDERSEARLLSQLGTLHMEHGQIAEAQARYDRSLEIHRRTGNRLLEAEVCNLAANLYAETGRAAEAYAHYERALEVFRELEDRQFEGITLGNLGSAYENRGLLEEARACYEQALRCLREVQDRRSEGQVLGCMANLCSAAGENVDARAHYEAALHIHREIGNRRFEGITLGNLGILLVAQGLTAEAQAHHEAALRIHREIGNRRFEGIALGNLGSILERRGLLEEAQAHYEQALQIAREVRNLRHAALLLGQLASFHADRGELAEARSRFTIAADTLRENSYPIELAGLLASHAVVEQRVGETATARGLLREAEQIATELGLAPDSELCRKLSETRTLVPDGLVGS